MKISAWRYYLQSIPVLLGGVQNWNAVIELLLRGNGRPTLIRLADGGEFYVRSLMDIWVLKETCLDRQYETYGTTIQSGWTVVDIGGGWGDFAISIARRNPDIRMVAFEPFPPSVELFQNNQNLNQVLNIELIQAAVGKTAGTLQLANSKKEAVQISTAESSSGESIVVRSVVLEEQFKELGISRCDFLKMDCEGGEYDILFSMTEDFLRKIDRICMETHDGVTKYSHSDLITFLESSGYQVRFEENPVHDYLGMLYAERKVHLEQTES